MPFLDMTSFGLLLLAAAVLIVRRDRRGAVLSLVLALIAGATALLALWLLRWQAAPAVVVSVLAAGACIILRWKGPGRSRSIGVVIAVITIGAALPYYFFPMFDLPAPDGPYRVGVRSFDLRDDSRHGVLFTAPDTPRDLPVTVWYPAPASATGPARPYFTRREALDEGRSVAKLWGFPFYRFLSLHAAGTHGIEGAPVASGGGFPVVLFSHGYWSFRAQNTALMERLASHGYIVVSIAHPRDGADVRLQNGTLIPTALYTPAEGGADPKLDADLESATAAFMGSGDHAKRIAALPAYKSAVAAHRLGQSIQAWRDDALFVARTLQAGPPASVTSIFAAADFPRTVYAGMSFGGSTATSACDADPNCIAAVDLDGENFDGAQFDREIRAPLLLLLTDQPFSEGQRHDPLFNPTDYAWETWQCIGDRPDIVRLRARGILHIGLTDFVLSAREPFRSENFARVEGNRALAMVNDTILAFLDRQVRGVPPARFQAVLARYPELERLNTDSLRQFGRQLPARAPCEARHERR